MALTISLGNGIVLSDSNGGHLRLDPRHGEGLFFVSHAHSDHLPSSVREDARVVCSEETFEMLSILGLRAKRASPENVRLMDSGHIIGSSMALVEVDGKKILYTGDFNVRPRYFLKGAKPAKCDVLVMESTYSLKDYKFPRLDELEKRVKEWLDGVEGAVMLGYNLGKAQILTAMANKLGYVPACQPSIFATNGLVEKMGYGLGHYEKYSPDLLEKKVVIGTPDMSDPDIASLSRRPGWDVAGFTGWAAAKKYRKSFPLSDHCGFDELSGFVRSCSPEKILLVHGKKSSQLQDELMADGWDVEHLGKGGSEKVTL